MIRYAHIKADYKQIFREPIMTLMYLVPMLLLVVAKLGITIMPKYITEYFAVDIFNYSPYILSCTLSMIFLMVGTATGFMMIDDKDGKIYELMQVTPLGRKGYIFNRLFLPVIITFFYSFFGWIWLDLNHHLFVGLLVSILMTSETILVGITLFHIADDKVKGLAYAKGLSLYALLTLVEIMNVGPLTFVAHFFPVFWITKMLVSLSPLNVMIAISVHVFFVYVYIKMFKNSPD